MPVSERDPSLMPEHQPCNWRLPKIPLIFFGWRRRVFKCGSACLIGKVMLGTLVRYGLPRAGNAGAALSPFGVDVVFLSNQFEAVQVYSKL